MNHMMTCPTRHTPAQPHSQAKNDRCPHCDRIVLVGVSPLPPKPYCSVECKLCAERARS